MSTYHCSMIAFQPHFILLELSPLFVDDIFYIFLSVLQIMYKALLQMHNILCQSLLIRIDMICSLEGDIQ